LKRWSLAGVDAAVDQEAYGACLTAIGVPVGGRITTRHLRRASRHVHLSALKPPRRSRGCRGGLTSVTTLNRLACSLLAFRPGRRETSRDFLEGQELQFPRRRWR